MLIETNTLPLVSFYTGTLFAYQQ